MYNWRLELYCIYNTWFLCRLVMFRWLWSPLHLCFLPFIAWFFPLYDWLWWWYITFCHFLSIWITKYTWKDLILKLHVRNIFETLCSMQLLWKLYCSFPLHLSRNLAYYGVKWVLKIKSCTYQKYFYNQFLTLGLNDIISKLKLESFHAYEKCDIIGLYKS